MEKAFWKHAGISAQLDGVRLGFPCLLLLGGAALGLGKQGWQDSAYAKRVSTWPPSLHFLCWSRRGSSMWEGESVSWRTLGVKVPVRNTQFGCKVCSSGGSS